MLTPQFLLPIHHELVIDLFAGGETLEALTAETWQLLCDNA